ncbi:EFR1 family ferrodoxin [candidate division FCPU426 bacterium]|nr:EFR1 family ferrodoxin [candidate division FCPU426 bacterium]
MQGLLCYYSGSGNTKLACKYMAKKVTHVQWKLFDVQRDVLPDLGSFDIIGFATFTDFWGVPQRMIQFLRAIPEQKGRLAFTFVTYGMFLGFALRDVSRLARSRGFKTIAGHALHTPENYPPMICNGMGMTDAPNPKELNAFQRFLLQLNNLCGDRSAGRKIKLRKIGENILFLIPAPKRTMARKQMGTKNVDQRLCTKCRTCEKGCPYKAIALNPYPVFNQDICYGCWACFHHCPQKAIYTSKFRGRGHYPRPIKQLEEKLL